MIDHTVTGAQQIERALDLLKAHAVQPIRPNLSQLLGNKDRWHVALDLIAEEARVDDDVVARAHYLLTRHHLRRFRPALTGFAEVTA